MKILRILALFLVVVNLILTFKYIGNKVDINTLEGFHAKSLQKIEDYKESVWERSETLARSCEDHLETAYQRGVFDVLVRTTFGRTPWKAQGISSPPIRNCRFAEGSYIFANNDAAASIVGVVAHCDAGLLGYTKGRVALACEATSFGMPIKASIVTSKSGSFFGAMANKYKLLKSGEGITISDKSIFNDKSFAFSDKRMKNTLITCLGIQLL